MKKLLASAAFVALAAPAAAQTTGAADYDVAGLVPTVCGLNTGSTINAAATDGGVVSFDFTNQKTSATTTSTSQIQAKRANSNSSFNSLVAYCNSPGGVTFAWTVNPLVRVGGSATNASDVINYRFTAQFTPASGNFISGGVASGFTQGAALTGSKAAFQTEGPFVAPGGAIFRAVGVQADNGAYSKNAGDYAGSTTLTLTAN